MAPGRKKYTKAGALAEMDDAPINAWLYGQRIRRANLDEIAAMATRPAIRDDLGRYSLDGGLGRTMNRSTVARRIQGVTAEHVADLGRDIEAQRILELDSLDRQAARLDDLVQRYALVDGMLTARDAKGRLDAELALLRISESRRKLLGIDSPVQVVLEATVTHHDGVAIELGKLLDQAEAKRKAKA